MFRHAPLIGSLLLGLLSAAPVASASGAAGGTRPPTLREVVQHALERDPQGLVLTSRGEEVDAFQERARGLLSGPPALYGLYRSDALGSDDGLQEMEADVELPLWRPGQRAAEQRAADARRAGLEHSRGALALTVAGRVRDAVWEVVYLRNELRLVKKEWETARALQLDVEKRVEAGELAKTDALLSREETLRKETDYIKAEAEAEHALLRYQALTGLDQLPRDPEEPRSAQQAITPAHPLLAEADAQVSTAQAKLSVASRSAGGNPDLLIGGKRERGGAGEDYNDSFQVAVRIPFNIGPAAKPEVAVAGTALAETEAARVGLERQLSTELRTAAHELETVGRRLTQAREQNRIAAENLHLARRAFDLGEIDLTGLQRVQSLAFAAERAEQQLKILRQRAIAQYNQAAGELP